MEIDSLEYVNPYITMEKKKPENICKRIRENQHFSLELSIMMRVKEKKLKTQKTARKK